MLKPVPLTLRLRLLLPALLLPGVLCAQDDAQSEEKPKLLFRMLAVGDAPPFRQVIRDGVRHEVDPPEGSIPPRELQIPAPGQEDPESVRVVLGRITQAVFVPAGTLSLYAVDDKGFREEKRWHSLQLPAKPASLALLWRAPGARTWTQAKSMVLADDLLAFPPGAVRFVNVTGENVAITIGGRKIGLRPGAASVIGGRGTPIRQVPLVVQVADGKGGWISVANTALNQAGNERSNIVIYPADGLKPRNPVKMSVMREQAILPKPPR